MLADGSKRVRNANKASAAELSKALRISDDPNFEVLTSSELSKSLREDIFAMLETNMRDFYLQSSFGWHPAEKRKEMFDPLSRFIVARRPDTQVLAGYSIFRFERENDLDMLYCYELQVSNTSRRNGLGRKLMDLLGSIGEAWHMQKIMLTVFEANGAALVFYVALGFVVDETSPDEDDDADYKILSMQLGKR
ncbi:acyl-CoA N-acyltransferase [Desarmillaria tabescens]|uniref:N-alpha-acetyltransferase 40 n=1 Tax=Armillaria tabescens TaxID=1929756 RepID=A0AA39NGC2_ARMTA|nr:acyl-CoA N-acyltransferase [Desarmillaria tabescens]KAK0465127.1 acyl-CoA N-acyltransferase [Desarmillaria tabescens]